MNCHEIHLNSHEIYLVDNKSHENIWVLTQDILKRDSQMPYINIWIHLIWSTKNRQPFINDEFKSKIFSHIRENAKIKGIYLDFINGDVDHIHTLISLKSEQSIAKVAHLLKGESSHWVNQNQLTADEFAWQEEYIAVSISHLAVNKVRDYIKNQEEHHKKRSFTEEYQSFIDKYGFEIIGKAEG